ncbi:MAG: hypothetical protein DCC55_06395 [Chloroflexi bacterium]|nr:MAG: hypothetical protein DCC55_06395 [Chloroflexota bacterium]
MLAGVVCASATTNVKHNAKQAKLRLSIGQTGHVFEHPPLDGPVRTSALKLDMEQRLLAACQRHPKKLVDANSVGRSLHVDGLDLANFCTEEPLGKVSG